MYSVIVKDHPDTTLSFTRAQFFVLLRTAIFGMVEKSHIMIL